MKYIKALILVVFFFISMLFFVQNTEILTNPLALKLNLFHWKLATPSMPLYLLVLMSFVCGTALTIMYFMGEKFRLASLAKSHKKAGDRLQNELKSTKKELEELRSLPLASERSYTPSVEATPQPMPQPEPVQEVAEEKPESQEETPIQEAEEDEAPQETLEKEDNEKKSNK